MPSYQVSPMFGLLTEAPTRLVPLYTVLAVLHQALSGKPVGSCVLTSHQISGALGHLGFAAEPVAACATLYRTTDTFTEISEIGMWKGPPLLRPDQTTTGHMIVWTSTFARLVDGTLVQDPTLLSMAHADPRYSIPVVAEVAADRDEFLRSQPVLHLDDRLYASWLLLPEWTTTTDTVLQGDLRTAATLGALGLARDALDVIGGLGADRDLRELPVLYPRLGALLAGQERLPARPAQAPSDPAPG